ncbi:unnamed protein product [Symbiodinium sp. CCMP2456]|nr:unnamed protein product [Symbiodinium sp. CCMP2456]
MAEDTAVEAEAEATEDSALPGEKEYEALRVFFADREDDKKVVQWRKRRKNFTSKNQKEKHGKILMYRKCPEDVQKELDKSREKVIPAQWVKLNKNHNKRLLDPSVEPKYKSRLTIKSLDVSLGSSPASICWREHPSTAALTVVEGFGSDSGTTLKVGDCARTASTELVLLHRCRWCCTAALDVPCGRSTLGWRSVLRLDHVSKDTGAKELGWFLIDGALWTRDKGSIHPTLWANKLVRRVCRSTTQAEAYTRQAGVEDGDVLRVAVTDIFGCLDMRRWEATSAKFVKQIWMRDGKSLEPTLSNPKCNEHSDKRLSIEIASLRQELWRKAGEKAGDPFYDDCKPADDQLTDIVRWIDTDVMIADPMTKVMEPTKLVEARSTWSSRSKSVVKKRAKQLPYGRRRAKRTTSRAVDPKRQSLTTLSL